MKTEINTDAPPLFYIPLLTGVGIRVFSVKEKERTFTVWSQDREKAISLLSACGKSATPLRKTFGQHFFQRCGLFVGFLFVLVLLVLSSQTVTDIEITGNTVVSADILRQTVLSAYSLPQPKNSIDCRALENDLTRLDGIASASVSVRGNTVFICISEEIPSVGRVGGQTCTGTYDAIVTEINLTSGHPLIRVGDTVLSGQTLAEGAVEGVIKGRVWFRSSCVYPPERIVHTRTGRKEIYYSLSDTVPYRGDFNLYEVQTEKVYFFLLPVSVYKITYYEITEHTEQINFEENFDTFYREQLLSLEKTLPTQSEKTKTWFFKKTVDKTGYLDIYYEVTTVLYESEGKQGA